MWVMINKMAFDNSNFTFVDPSCNTTQNATHIMLNTKFNECGTTIMETDETITYQNIAVNRLSSENATYEGSDVITRDNVDAVTVQCTFYKKINSSLMGGFNTSSDTVQITEGKSISTYYYLCAIKMQFNINHLLQYVNKMVCGHFAEIVQ